MSDTDDIQIAEQRLRAVPGYDWLVDADRMFWSAPNVANHLAVNLNTVKKWCADGLIPGAVDFGATGWRIPRGGLIVYLAARLSSGRQSQA